MDDMTEKAKRTSDDAMADIQSTVASIDGISTGDVFRLASLIREYGNIKAGEAMSSLMKPILGSLVKRDDEPKW